jgi:hypothetical protein
MHGELIPDNSVKANNLRSARNNLLQQLWDTPTLVLQPVVISRVEWTREWRLPSEYRLAEAEDEAAGHEQLLSREGTSNQSSSSAANAGSNHMGEFG